MDNDNIFPLAIHGEGVPAKRAGVRSKNTVIIPCQNNSLLPQCESRPMKHRIVPLLLLLSAAFCGVLLSCRCAWSEDIFQNRGEEELLREVNGGHYIKTRPQIEEILRTDANSISANYMMGIVFWNGEGNLHRAVQYVKKALQLFEAKYCDNEAHIPQSGELVSWHQRLYSDLANIYGELDMRELEYDVRVKLAELYHAKLAEDSVWCLIKLRRFDEAETISTNTIAESSLWASKAYNDLMTLEDARNRYTASYRMSVRSVEYHAGKSCVILMNHANALVNLMRFEEGIQYYLKAAAIGDGCHNNHPLSGLSLTYLFDGQWQKSISAISRLVKRKVDRRHAVQTEMVERAELAGILYTMGFAERAQELMYTVVNAPSRLGHNSGDKGQHDMANRTEYFAILHDASLRAKEALDAYTTLEPLWFWDEKLRTRVKEILEKYVESQRRLWSNNQKLFKDVLVRRNRMGFVVPNVVLSIHMLPSVVDSLGLRAAEFLIEEQIHDLDPEDYEAMKSSFTYMKAYIAWRDGDRAKLREYIDRYRLERVPHVKLVDLEIDLMDADLMMQEGNRSGAYEMFSKVYVDYPSVFRSRDVRLPVRLDESLPHGVRDVLQNSPRFEALDDAPFVLSAERRDDGFLVLCIASTMGQRYACSSVNPMDYPHIVEGVPHDAEVIHNFLHIAFTPRIDMSQTDIHSLNGSTTMRTADEALADLLAPSAIVRNESILDVSDLMNE